MNGNDPKIFGIGLTKTGTTTLHFALRMLGFRSCHSRHVIEPVIEFNLKQERRLLRGLSDVLDAFVDFPIMYYFEKLDEQYPGSRFIWTVRDKESWLVSKAEHIRRFVKNKEEWPTHGTPDDWSRWYDEHNARVERYFKGREDILKFQPCHGDGWKKLCTFLGIDEIPVVEFPHAQNRHKPELLDPRDYLPDP